MTAHTRLLAGALLATAIVTAACGGGGHATGVASLANAHTTTTAKSTKSKAAAKQEMQDAALAFARCMREHGVDMPDPTFKDDGGKGGFAIQQSGPAGSGVGPDNPSFQAAQKACQPIMDKAEQDMPRPSAEEQAKMRDQALKFAKCMRAHGVDMPDPTFDSNGGSKIEMHADAGGGNSGPVTKGDGSNPAPPKEDPKFQAAAKACGGPGGGFAVSGGPR